MIRALSALFAAAVLTTPVVAHFIFVVPQPGGKMVQVVFSDDLEPDEGVAIDSIAKLALVARDDAGKEASLKTTLGKHQLTATPPAGSRVLFGSFTYGVMQKGTTPPYQLRYHPKTLLGDPFAKTPIVGDRLPIEVIPVGKAGAVRFRVLAKGKPLAGAELNVLVPKGDKQKVSADAEGLSPTFTAKGRYGVWTKHFEKAAGEYEGKKFEEIRHYGTLVVDVGEK
jgi:hypothetical protein